MSTHTIRNLNAVSRTLLIPLYFRADDRDMEAWAPGIRLLSQWCYFDKPGPRLGNFQLMRYFPFFTRMVRIVHYRLGKMGTED